MPFDYKKEYKEFYLPPRTPTVVNVPTMSFAAVRGMGNPNTKGGEYQQAIELLYGITFTIKMAPRAGHTIEGYFPYVAPPLEGFWWMRDSTDIDTTRKEDFGWISCIRLPDFVNHEIFDWAVTEAQRKKKKDFSPVAFLTLEEGLCVQALHVGPYDTEADTVEALDNFAATHGYELDFSESRRHHEIYLSDARRTAPQRLRTVIRHPIRRADSLTV